MERPLLWRLSRRALASFWARPVPTFITRCKGAAVFLQNRPARLRWSVQGWCRTQGSALTSPGLRSGPRSGRACRRGRRAAREKEAAGRGGDRMPSASWFPTSRARACPRAGLLLPISTLALISSAETYSFLTLI